jgi:riboflavin biosynthesis pyrimidine reductase
MRVTYYTAASIDGRVAGPGDDMSFLEASSGATGWTAFIASVDAVVVGASTVRWLLDQGHGWPHGDLPTWLVSRDPGLVERIGPTEQPLRRVEGELAPTFAAIRDAGHEHVWLVGGGTIAALALAADAIDTIVVTHIPAVLGAGPSLFAGNVGPGARGWELADLERNGTNAQLTWRRVRD